MEVHSKGEIRAFLNSGKATLKSLSEMAGCDPQTMRVLYKGTYPMSPEMQMRLSVIIDHYEEFPELYADKRNPGKITYTKADKKRYAKMMTLIEFYKKVFSEAPPRFPVSRYGFERLDYLIRSRMRAKWLKSMRLLLPDAHTVQEWWQAIQDGQRVRRRT